MGFCLEVAGDFACFTRPEMKVERVSYDVITPSAARAIFEAILWKPAISWQIDRIEVLQPIRWINLRRNELSSVIPMMNVTKAMKGGTMPHCSIEDDRQQRAGLFLRDVRYRLHGHFMMTNKAGTTDSEAKFAEMFRRRAQKGQCFNQPYLGCREFSCSFELIEEEPATPAINESRPLGWMLYDIDHSGREPTPLFFNAMMQNGVIEVPPRHSEEVRG
ncbi:type I-C CRISPR-associated protein Cas5 [Ectothiorhodospiraceae bacterium BW-2]|nr:type I-C CRISPR-associated protein Cas5 [Ectothiorhodospiraceae bacterium BW-2]